MCAPLPNTTETAAALRTCRACGAAKPVAAFGADRSRCKACRAEDEGQRRAARRAERGPTPRPAAEPPSLPGEVWWPVPHVEGLYEASSLGRVRSVTRYVTRKDGSGQVYAGTILRPQRAGNKATRPYLHVNLYGNGQRVGVFVHQLVAWAFLGEPPAGHHVHHLNGDSLDNRASNLAYRPERAHLSSHQRGQANNAAVLSEEDVHAIRRLLRRGLPGAQIARLYGVGKSTIYKIRQGKTWAHVPIEPPAHLQADLFAA